MGDKGEGVKTRSRASRAENRHTLPPKPKSMMQNAPRWLSPSLPQPLTCWLFAARRPLHLRPQRQARHPKWGTGLRVREVSH